MGFFNDWQQKREDALREERKGRIEQALSKLNLIPSAAPLVRMSREKQMFIRITAETPGNAFAVYRPSRFIDVSPACSTPHLPTALAHELRHADQNERGLSLRQKLNIHDNLIITRFAEADAYAFEAQVAWELAKHGIEPKAWNNYKSRESKLAKAYLAALEADPAADENGKALRAVFHAWFEDPGLKNSYDADALRESREQLDRVQQGLRANTLQDRKRTDGEAPLMSVAHLREFGLLPDGKNYLETVNTRRPIYISQLAPQHQKDLKNLTERATNLTSGKKAPVPKL